jgi:hypothetical protein
MLQDPRIDTNVPKSGEWTPLYTAVQNGHLAVVRLLLGCPRVDVNRTTRVSTSVVPASHSACLCASRWSPCRLGSRSRDDVTDGKRRTSLPTAWSLLSSHSTSRLTGAVAAPPCTLCGPEPHPA